MKNIIHFIESIVKRIGNLVSWLTTLLMLVVCADVFTRYVLNQSSVAIQELEWHLFAIIFLFGAAYAYQNDRHVRVDVIYSRLSEKQKALIDILGNLLFLIPFAVLIIRTSLPFVENSWMTKEISPDPGGLPGRYILKSVIPLAFVLILLQSIAEIGKNIQKIIAVKK